MFIRVNETDENRRKVYFHLVSAGDYVTPVLEEDGSPEISLNGGGFTSDGIGDLVEIGHGRYYAVIEQATVSEAGTHIETRYKSDNTAECPGDSAVVVYFDPYRDSASDYSSADVFIDRNTDPTCYHLVYKIKGTSTEIARKELRDIDGAKINTEYKIPRQLLEVVAP